MIHGGHLRVWEGGPRAWGPPALAATATRRLDARRHPDCVFHVTESDPVNRPSDADPSDPPTGWALLELQRAAYAVEAQLIGDQGIPNLTESVADLLRASLH